MRIDQDTLNALTQLANNALTAFEKLAASDERLVSSNKNLTDNERRMLWRKETYEVFTLMDECMSTLYGLDEIELSELLTNLEDARTIIIAIQYASRSAWLDMLKGLGSIREESKYYYVAQDWLIDYSAKSITGAEVSGESGEHVVRYLGTVKTLLDRSVGEHACKPELLRRINNMISSQEAEAAASPNKRKPF